MKRSKTTSVLALSLAAFMACKKPAATQDKASPATATPAVAATAPATATTTAAATVASTTPIYISPGVPANALAVMAIDGPANWSSAMLKGLGFADKEIGESNDEVFGYLKKTTGLEFAGLQHISGFLLANGHGAALIDNVGGALTFKPTLDAGIEIANEGNTLIIGMPDAIAAARDALQGKADSLASGKGKLAGLIKDSKVGASAIAAIDASAIPDPEVAAAVAQYGVQDGVVSIGDHGFQLAIDGDPTKLQLLSDLLKVQMAAAIKAIDDQHAAALANANSTDGPNAEALGAVLGWHTVHHFATAVTPVLAGNRLKMSLDLSPSSGVMAMTYVGVAAAVAIPAFIKYTSRSKDAAAQMNGTLVH